MKGPHAKLSSGRFMTPDPYRASGGGPGNIADPGSWNRYAYVKSDPINRFDPFGLLEASPDIECGEGEACDGGEYEGSNGGGGEGGAPPQGGGGGTATVLLGVDPHFGNDLKKVQDAIKTFKSFLDNDPDCKNFLSSGIDKGIFDYMYDATGRLTGPAVLQNGINATTGAIGSGYSITINANGAFFNGSTGVGYADRHSADMARVVAGTVGAQIFILLHESAHFFGAKGFLFDGNDDEDHRLSKRNNDLLWDKCSKTIKAGISASWQ